MRVRKKNKNSLIGKSETELNNINQASKDYIKSVIEGLNLGDGEFLLAVAWVTRTCAWHLVSAIILFEILSFQ